jgi:predicted nuclease of restriction endonuclease-like (RecB) superfamily
MNPARQEGNHKIAQILTNEIKRWETMTKEALIGELIEEKRFFLETELEYGNEDYLDELLEEIA